jgi:hypothetical protein
MPDETVERVAHLRQDDSIWMMTARRGDVFPARRARRRRNCLSLSRRCLRDG